MRFPLFSCLIIAITIVLFITEPVPIVVTAIGASIAYAYTGIIEIKDIFSGYNSTTIVLLAGMMTVGWTQYKFLDFLKIGIPMLLVTYIVIIAITPFYLPC